MAGHIINHQLSLFGKKKKANCQDIMRHGNWLWAINSATGNWKNKSHIFSFSHRSITFHQQLISCHSRVSVRSHRNVLFFKGIFNLHKELCAFAVVYVFYKDFSEVLCFRSKRTSSSPYLIKLWHTWVIWCNWVLWYFLSTVWNFACVTGVWSSRDGIPRL